MPTPVWYALALALGLHDRKERLSFPIGILGNFDYHYALYDGHGDVMAGAATFREAMAIRRDTGFSITRILDRRE